VKEVKVSIIGFGTVGAGAAEILLKNREVITKRTSMTVTLTRIADLDITTDRGVSVPPGLLTTNVDEAIDAADIVVELVGGTGFAKDLILKAISRGKHIVTANKALLAMHGEEIFAAAAKHHVDVYYEASVAGGIPIIKALREGLVANRINRIYGIMNGTCNYILTRMEREGLDFDVILSDAQKLGYAEANPSLDIDGFDTAHKASILASLAYGKWFGLAPVFVEGIRGLSLFDLRCADELGYRIKLLAIIKNVGGKVQIRVHPALVPKTALLANVAEVFNAVMVDGDNVGSTLFYGRGAGRSATASAVCADIADAALNIVNGCVNRVLPFRAGELYDEVMPMNEVSTRYYLRLSVVDQPGVLAAITAIFGKNSISISSFIQHEVKDGGAVPLVILTHIAREEQLQSAIREIESLPICKSAVKILRIEDI